MGSGRGAREQVPVSRPEALALAGARTIPEFAPAGNASPSPEGPAPRPRRLAWAELLRRVFAIDVLACPRCGGRMRLLAAIYPPNTTQAMLECLELLARAPPAAPPRPEDAGDGAAWDPDFEAGA